MTRLRELIDGYDECLTLRREIRAWLNGAARRARHLDAQRHRCTATTAWRCVGRRRRPGHRRLLRVLDRHRLEQRRHRALMAAIFSCFFARRTIPCRASCSS